MKALIYASVASMIQQFNIPNIKLLQELGYKVEVACSFEAGTSSTDVKIEMLKKKLKSMNVKYHDIPVPRSITNIKSIRSAYKTSVDLLNQNKYDLIHCHSPIGSVIARLANKKSNNYDKCRMIYTAHGFHFFKGAPFLNWCIFYPIEKYCSKYTDTIITINDEDYKIALNKLKARCVYKINGVGIDYESIISSKPNEDIKREIGIDESDLILLSVGELNSNKNHEVIIDAINKLNNNKIKYLIAGRGDKYTELSKKINNYKMNKQVYLLGYRDDVYSLCKIADIFAFPSKREGLGLAAIEAMASGLFLITSNVHGINDYSKIGVTGDKTSPNDLEGFSKIIQWCYENKSKVKSIGFDNIARAKKYDIENIQVEMRKIYIND